MAKVISMGHFPFCPIEVPSTDYFPYGPNQSYQVALTKEELIYLYWKVKSIHFEIASTLTVHESTYSEFGYPPPPDNPPTPTPTDPQSFAGTYNNNGDIQRANTINEAELVCVYPFQYSFLDNLSAVSINISFDSIYLVKGTPDLYYPAIDVSGAFHSTNGYVDWGQLGFIDTSKFEYNNDGSSCTLDIFGTSPKTIYMGLAGVGSQVFTDIPIWGIKEMAFFTYYPHSYTSNGGAIAYDLGTDADPVNAFWVRQYNFKASASTNLAITTKDTWPYNP
jgi:hypothetical protein